MNKYPLKKIEVFNLLKKISIENLESEEVEILKAVAQASLAKRSGYDVHEFKIHGIISDS